MEGSPPLVVDVDDFYNVWGETFFYRLIIDVRSEEEYKENHASMALHCDPSATSKFTVLNNFY